MRSQKIIQKIKTCSTKKSSVILPTYYQHLDFFFEASPPLKEESCVARALVGLKVEREVSGLKINHEDEPYRELHGGEAEYQKREGGQEEVVEDRPEYGGDEEEEGPHEL